MSRAYDPSWPFPQYDERGERLLPPEWTEGNARWVPPGPGRTTRAELERELRQGAGEALL